MQGASGLGSIRPQRVLLRQRVFLHPQQSLRPLVHPPHQHPPLRRPHRLQQVGSVVGEGVEGIVTAASGASKVAVIVRILVAAIGAQGEWLGIA